MAKLQPHDSAPSPVSRRPPPLRQRLDGNAQKPGSAVVEAERALKTPWRQGNGRTRRNQRPTTSQPR